MKPIFLLAAGALALGVSAQADMRWKTEMKIEMGNMGGRGGAPGGMKPSISYTTAVTDGAQRKESQMSLGPFGTSDTVITLCGQKQRIQIDDGLKIYAMTDLTDDDGGFVNPMAGLGKMMPPGMRLPGMPAAPQGVPGEGKIVSTITAEDKGEETVADTPAHRWLLTIASEKSGCAGTGTDTVKMEVWSANFNEPVFCPAAAGANPVRDFHRAMNPNSNCKITYEMKGDGAESFGKIFHGLVMRLKVYDPKTGNPAITQEVTMLTRAKQEATLFAIPDGYQKVTPEEFQQKKAQAMMQKILGGAGGF